MSELWKVVNALLNLSTCLNYFYLDFREDIAHRTRRKSFSENVTRKHLVTRRDILNIKTRVQDQAIIKHQDDATSVMLAVAELQQEDFNPVLYFKQQHVVDEQYPQFSREAFLLMFQSEFQQQIYLRFASKILCIDSTHGTNAYKFKLLTAMVADDFAAGKNICSCLVLVCMHVPSKMSAHMDNCYVQVQVILYL